MRQPDFFGRKVVAATFVMAAFGWGIGFYGPPIFLYAVIQRTGWSPALCSSAVTLHFLAGTLVVINLPALYKRFGLPCITVAGAVVLACGVYGWAVATQHYQLFIAALLSGLGWVTMGAAAVNAIIAPWFVARRPAALAMAYNGASIGGVIFSSTWVYLINQLGFSHAALLVGLVSTGIITLLAIKVFKVRPEQLGQHADGANAAPAVSNNPAAKQGLSLWADRRFLTLAAAMSLGLFAQIGLISQLFLLLTQQLTEQTAALAMGLATVSAIGGRSLASRLLRASTHRRRAACISYGCQLLGCLAIAGTGLWSALLWLGVVLFGLGIGNATSLPPLIAQSEFSREQLQRVVTLIVASAQACYAFAPALFGVVKAGFSDAQGDIVILGLAAGIQGLAILMLAIGSRRPTPL